LRPFDTAGVFHPADESGGLRRRAVRGAGVTVFTSGLGLVLQIVSTVVLSRLLTPKDFGVVTMVTTFSLLLVNFGLNGFTEAIVQWEEVDRVLASNLFWISIGAGLLLTVSFAAAGALMARFYRDPLVTRSAR
jgi:O-antigen/teichoic acid export membrane protein